MILHRHMVSVGVSCKPAPFGYTDCSAETTVDGFGDPNNVGGLPPIAAFFMSVMPSRASFYGGPGGAAFGLAGANVPVRQPRCQARHPSFGDERRASTINVGGRNG